MQRQPLELESTSAGFEAESPSKRRGRIAAEDRVRALERELERELAAEKAERASLGRLRSLRKGSSRE